MPLGSTITNLFGSNKAPKAVLNRYAASTATALGRLGAKTVKSVSDDSDAAYAAYTAGQPKQASLAADQEGVLRTLLARRMGSSPDELLRSIGKTAFSFIDPEVVSPLARFDVNYDKTARMARGINPAAVNSTSERLRNSRIASGRYYDVANRAYAALPGLFDSAYAQGVNDDVMSSAYIPKISQAFEAVASRPTTGILSRVNAANAAAGLGQNVIQSILASTQGYKTPRNFADRLGSALTENENTVMGLAKSALGAVSGMGGGEGGGGGGSQPTATINPSVGGAGYSPAFYAAGPQ